MDHILVFKSDLAKYPPLQTIIKILIEENKSVLYLGYCSDTNLIKNITSKGVIYHQSIEDDIRANIIVKFLSFITFIVNVKKCLKKYATNLSQVWIFGTESIWLLNKIPLKYKSILYFFEVPNFDIPFRYRIFCSPKKYCNSVRNKKAKVVCCEYNRAHITKSYFQLKHLPYTIPNKPYINLSDIDSCSEIKIDPNKKIILYQGIFNYPERNLEPFCQAILSLGEEYVLVLMGGPENDYKQMLQNKYKSEQIIFLPYCTSPHHLNITAKAHIGVLSYSVSRLAHIQASLNILYCAPNKIYEYAFFNIPMIGNDVPALNKVFKEFNAGICVSDLTTEKIIDGIKEIEKNYSEYKKGSSKLYNSVDIVGLIKQVIYD